MKAALCAVPFSCVSCVCALDVVPFKPFFHRTTTSFLPVIISVCGGTLSSFCSLVRNKLVVWRQAQIEQMWPCALGVRFLKCTARIILWSKFTYVLWNVGEFQLFLWSKHISGSFWLPFSVFADQIDRMISIECTAVVLGFFSTCTFLLFLFQLWSSEVGKTVVDVFWFLWGVTLLTLLVLCGNVLFRWINSITCSCHFFFFFFYKTRDSWQTHRGT